MQPDPVIPEHPTPESIAAAKRAQAWERAQVMAATGIVIDEEGRIGRLMGQAIVDALTLPKGHES